MTHSVRFDKLAVAVPSELACIFAHPLLMQLTERLQNTPDMHGKSQPSDDTNGISRSKRVLDTLIQTSISDAAVLVAITNEPTPKLLLTRRAGHLNSHAGEVSFAGGKHEAADGNNVVTALREACEETALPPSRVQLIGQLPVRTAKSGLSIRPIVALVEPDVTYVPELGEIERVFWADLQTLKHQPTVDYEFCHVQDGQSHRLVTPCWYVDGEVVWGLTGRIIADLLECAFDRHIDWYFRPLA